MHMFYSMLYETLTICSYCKKREGFLKKVFQNVSQKSGIRLFVCCSYNFVLLYNVNQKKLGKSQPINQIRNRLWQPVGI